MMHQILPEARNFPDLCCTGERPMPVSRAGRVGGARGLVAPLSPSAPCLSERTTFAGRIVRKSAATGSVACDRSDASDPSAAASPARRPARPAVHPAGCLPGAARGAFPGTKKPTPITEGAGVLAGLAVPALTAAAAQTGGCSRLVCRRRSSRAPAMDTFRGWPTRASRARSRRAGRASYSWASDRRVKKCGSRRT